MTRSSPEEDDDGASATSEDSIRFMPVNIGDEEELEFYRKGGFHPVHIGELYGDSRYKIIHKLGAGGFSTIWLARDLHAQEWVALKIVVADRSEGIVEKMVTAQKMLAKAGLENYVFTRYFHIQGPNGRHLCLVLPFHGPSTYTMSRYLQSRIHPGLVRKISLQAVQAVAELHCRELCHGDITPSNMVFKLQNLNHLDERGLYLAFGEPRIGRLTTYSGDIPGPEAPRYIVEYMDFLKPRESYILDEITLIDFDQSFPASKPPKKRPGIPEGFLAPEVAAGRPASPASDVWALGCSILHIRAGSTPFASMEVDCPAHVLRRYAEFLGDLPEDWVNTLFDFEGKATDDLEEGAPLSEIPSYNKSAFRDWIGQIWDQPDDAENLQSYSASKVTGREENDAYPECYKGRFWRPSAIRINNIYLAAYSYEVDKIIEGLPKISVHEADLLYDLLTKIFVYDPKLRPTAREVLSHPWFSMDHKSA